MTSQMSKVYDRCLQKNCVFLNYGENVLWWYILPKAHGRTSYSMSPLDSAFAEKRKWLPHTFQILLQNATYGNITSVTRDVYSSHRVWVYQKGSVCQYLFGSLVNVFCAFYDLGWLPVGHPNIQKRNQVRV